MTRANRDEVIARVRDAITACGAWVVDVKLFSNVSICFSFEVPLNRVGQLRNALAATELHVTRDSDDSFASLPVRGAPDTDGLQEPDVAGTLQITFIHSEPDLRIEVPRIPG